MYEMFTVFTILCKKVKTFYVCTSRTFTKRPYILREFKIYSAYFANINDTQTFYLREMQYQQRHQLPASYPSVLHTA